MYAKTNFSNAMSSLDITDMTNHELLWKLMIETLHSNTPNPKFTSKYEAYKACNGTEAITNAGTKEGFIRTKIIPSIDKEGNPVINPKTNLEDQTTLVAISDVEFYHTIYKTFQRAKDDGLVKPVKILGFNKYEVVNFSSQKGSLAKHQASIMNKFVDDYLQTTYGTSLEKLLKI